MKEIYKKGNWILTGDENKLPCVQKCALCAHHQGVRSILPWGRPPIPPPPPPEASQ